MQSRNEWRARGQRRRIVRSAEREKRDVRPFPARAHTALFLIPYLSVPLFPEIRKKDRKRGLIREAVGDGPMYKTTTFE